MRVAFQGAQGAFGEVAALALWPDAEPVGVPSFGDVVDWVMTGRAERGVLPVENVIVGPIVAALVKLRAAHELAVRGEVVLPVRLHLLGCAGAERDSVRRIAAHPVALAQCRAFLRRVPLAAAQEWYDSAGAARAVAECGDPTFAAIAGEMAGLLYGLDTLQRDVHDHVNNATRFVGIQRRP